MPFYSIDDPDFWDAVTPEPLRWTQAAPRAAGMEFATIPLTETLDDDTPAASILRLPPGGFLPRHAHHCLRVEFLLRGTLDVGDGRILNPGAVMISPPGEYYGPHFAGPEGAVSIEIFSKIGAPTDFDDQDDPRMTALINMAIEAIGAAKAAEA